MTLDEAIKYCIEVAEHNEALIKRGYAGGCNSHDCSESAEIHRQLAEWLTELRERRAVDEQHGNWSKQALVSDGFGGFRVGYICSVCKHFVPSKGN